MNQRELHNFTTYFLEGKLSEENELKLLHWIKASDKNKQLFLQEQEYIIKTIAEKHDQNLERKWQKFKQRIEPKPTKSKTLILWAASVAAAFLIGALISTVVFKTSNQETTPIVQIQKVVTPYGAKTNFQLPDGSIVWLNSGSELSFPSRFDGARPVTLTGEAFFEVEKSAKPFTVSTIYGEVEVQGTSFDVKAFLGENFQVTLEEGAIIARAKNIDKELALRPGQQVNLLGDKMVVSEVQTDLFTSWKEGKLIFRDEELPLVAKRLERWYNVKIELEEDSRLANLRYNGTLEMESFSEVLQLLKVTAPIDYSYNEKTRTIKITYKQR
jgi:ferric-dicitrate binding protein FerR (iron transport regulator)